ncbi:MAG: ABC transporter substrate-binding protein [Bdellovibrionales bacterium]|nr:ABC transporter substrate-binding protein [Bdellovibrionales bacterium]
MKLRNATPLRTFICRSLLVVSAAVLLLACEQKEQTTFRIGVSPWPGYGILSIAHEKGYFAEQGVSVEVVHFDEAEQLYQAFYNGSLDGISGTLNEMITVRENSPRSPQSFLVADFSNGADRLLAREKIATVAELKGKKVGVEFSAVGVYLVARALEKAGLTLDDIRLVNLPNDQLAEELAKGGEQGGVDAVAAYPPASTEIEAREDVGVLFTSQEIPGEIVDVVALDAEIIRNNRSRVEGIVTAFDKAVRFLHAHPEEAHQMIAKSEQMSVDEVRSTLAELRVPNGCEQKAFFVPNGTLTEAVKTADLVMRRLNLISGPDRTVGMVSFGPIQTAMTHCDW